MVANSLVYHYYRDKACVDIELIEGGYSDEDLGCFFESKP